MSLLRYLLFITFFISSSFIYAQDSSLFTWQTSARKIDAQQYELTFSTPGAPGWQLFSPNLQLEDFSTASIAFPDSSITQSGLFSDTGVSIITNSAIFEKEVKIYTGPSTWKAVIVFSGTVPASLQGTLSYTYGRNDEFYPSTQYSFSVALEGGVASTSRILIPTIDIKKPVNDCGDEDPTGKSMLTIFLLGLLGGFIALLTPCVFPMIPLTVSFFTKKTESKQQGVINASLYGLFIFLIYVLLTIPFHLADKTNPAIFNEISTNVVLNIVFFFVFILFALSFFGLFELTIPSAIANRVDSKSNLGNVGGIFFMALTLAIVSFSCTGPILGSLLFGVADEGAWPLTAGAAGFGVALGLPFALFAMFPQGMQSMPKSGGWLTEVKVVLGFIELALAIKFLANADNVKQWGFLKREVFIASWVIIGIAIVLYLAGVFRFGNKARVKFTTARVVFIAVFAAVTIYLLPGLTNTEWARLKLISGFPPPLSYSVYAHNAEQHGVIEPLRDYEEALALARKENKPLLIDFTGWACVNCRRMEEKVWVDSDVKQLMLNDFIVVSLYVDERIKLPVQEQMVYKTKTGVQKNIVTVGDKWTIFQTENFNATSQPQYAIISTDERALVRTKFYTPSPNEFAEWLRCGLDAAKK